MDDMSDIIEILRLMNRKLDAIAARLDDDTRRRIQGEKDFAETIEETQSAFRRILEKQKGMPLNPFQGPTPSDG